MKIHGLSGSGAFGDPKGSPGPPVLRVFSQAEEPDFASFAANASAHFSATLTVVAREANTARLRLTENEEPGEGSDHDIAWRPTVGVDRIDAEGAEQRGRAGGMAALAARCPLVIELRSRGPEASTLTLAAVIASVSLGPVLPADGSTLFGVRGARERIERIRAKLRGP